MSLTPILRLLALGGLVSALIASPVHAQVVGQDASVLEGIDAVDAQVSVSWRSGITEDGGPTEASYETAYLTALRAQLAAGGLQISEEAPNYLYCSIALLYSEDTGIVSAAQSVELHEPIGEDGQWAITWMQSQVYTVGLQNFDGADDAQWCGEEFVREWREANGV